MASIYESFSMHRGASHFNQVTGEPGVRFLKKLTTVRRRKPIRLTLRYV